MADGVIVGGAKTKGQRRVAGRMWQPARTGCQTHPSDRPCMPPNAVARHVPMATSVWCGCSWTPVAHLGSGGNGLLGGGPGRGGRLVRGIMMEDDGGDEAACVSVCDGRLKACRRIWCRVSEDEC